VSQRILNDPKRPEHRVPEVLRTVVRQLKSVAAATPPPSPQLKSAPGLPDVDLYPRLVSACVFRGEELGREGSLYFSRGTEIVVCTHAARLARHGTCH